MKSFICLLMLFLASKMLFAQEAEILNESPILNQEEQVQEQKDQETDLFSDELYMELLFSIQDRYSTKDEATLSLRKKELEKILKHRSSLDSKTRQRLEIEWIVILDELNKLQSAPY